MIENFPILENGQAALLRVEIATGHVLDEQLKLTTSSAQRAYTVFNNETDALKAAKSIILANENIECVIYGKDKIVLSYLNFKNI